MEAWSNAGQGVLQLEELGLAFVLCAALGLERELRLKSAGLRTYSLVGLASALFMLVSKYGFSDVLEKQLDIVDPSRVAAQIVSGMGFIGGGVIFMRRDIVRGLTTAASLWVAAAIGMACGAGLPILAIAVAAANFIIMLVFPLAARLLPKKRHEAAMLRIIYQDGRGLLRDILAEATRMDFSINHLEVDRNNQSTPAGGVCLSLRLDGRQPVTRLIARLEGIGGVISAGTLIEDGLE